mmetsp:Transcript_17840/g.55379  ORF Transcript_17840/g.55379 Transcript_17840/m.55379 type:complete len:327 (-) Transcript_17840:1246-2226(-)
MGGRGGSEPSEPLHRTRPAEGLRGPRHDRRRLPIHLRWCRVRRAVPAAPVPALDRGRGQGGVGRLRVRRGHRPLQHAHVGHPRRRVAPHPLRLRPDAARADGHGVRRRTQVPREPRQERQPDRRARVGHGEAARARHVHPRPVGVADPRRRRAHRHLVLHRLGRPNRCRSHGAHDAAAGHYHAPGVLAARRASEEDGPPRQLHQRGAAGHPHLQVHELGGLVQLARAGRTARRGRRAASHVHVPHHVRRHHELAAADHHLRALHHRLRLRRRRHHARQRLPRARDDQRDPHPHDVHPDVHRQALRDEDLPRPHPGRAAQRRPQGVR